jgi:hypothetical protein
VIRVFLNVLRFLLLLLVVRFVVRTVARAFAAGSERPRTPSGPGQAQVRPPEDLVLDPVCRTHVPRSRALVARVGGREEHFCSTACRDRALSAVARAS